MCRLRNKAKHDFQESVNIGQTDGQTPTGSLCADMLRKQNTRTDTQTQDRVIPMYRYALQATQKHMRDLGQHNCKSP